MKIDKELRKIKGIYKILNTINNKCYIGSSIDLYNRGSTYKCLMKQGKLHNKHLQASFNKYGIENFKFIILKKCNNEMTIENLHSLEQQYINIIEPEYNKRIIVDTNHLLNHSQKTKDKISKSLKNSFKNGNKIINRIQEHNIQVSLFDLKGNHIQDFPGLSFCAEYIGVKYTSISYAIKSKRRRIKDFIVLKREDSHLVQKFINIPRITYKKTIVILNVNTGIYTFFNTSKDCLKFLNISHSTLKKYFSINKIIKNKYKIVQYGTYIKK